MRALRSRRGSSLLIATLAMLALIAASTGAMVAIVVAHAQRVSHQARGVQALYLAEMGVEEMLCARAAGRETTSIRRTVPAEPEPAPVGEGALETPAGGGLVDGADIGSVVGSYEVRAEKAGRAIEIRSTGIVPTPGGKTVTREVRVICRAEEGGWALDRWEQVP